MTARIIRCWYRVDQHSDTLVTIWIENDMAKETEIKLRISPASLSTLPGTPVLAARYVGPWQTRELA